MDKTYKYNFLTCKVNIENPHKLMKDMINAYIEKLRDDIERYSKPESKNNGDRIQICADKIIELLEWRDNMEFIGSDEVFNMSNLDYKDRFHKFYLY